MLSVDLSIRILRCFKMRAFAAGLADPSTLLILPTVVVVIGTILNAVHIIGTNAVVAEFTVATKARSPACAATRAFVMAR